MLILDAIPWGKLFKLGKVKRAVGATIDAIKAWKAAKRAAEVVLRTARAAIDAAKTAKRIAIEKAKQAAQAAAKKAAEKTKTTGDKIVNATKKTGNPTHKQAQAKANPKGSSAGSGGGGKKSGGGGEKSGGGGDKKSGDSAGAGDRSDGGTSGSGCKTNNSFVPGTTVLMADGSAKPIEDVEPGDKVKVADPETGETGVETVTASIRGDGVKQLVKVTIDTDGDRGTDTAEVTATDGHPFWVPELGEWIDATDLRSGEWLQTSAGTYVQVTAIKRWTVLQATVHNLTVGNTHTYYVLAGTTPVLVHNCNLADIAANHRANANGGQGVAPRKNIAVMRAEIDGQSPATTIATSGRHVNPGEVSMPTTRQFTPPNPSRAYDSEVFLFEDLASGLSPTATGNVHLYSERTVCPSCEGVIGQFKAKFPGINVHIKTGED